MPETGSRFPPYVAGQYIALRRNNCKLTRKQVDESGKVHYVPDLDEQGNQRIGPVTHSYSIATAPYETEQRGYLEFYIVLEGRLTHSFFQMDPETDNEVFYYDRITGDFTLEKRAKDFEHVLMIGTGTGVAPFVSMIKQLHYEASQGKKISQKFTLIHANRTTPELNYREVFENIAAEGKMDFVYVPSVSRPTPQDIKDTRLGKGRANNILRHILDLPLKEEESLAEAQQRGEGVEEARNRLEKTVKPVLPEYHSRAELKKRLLDQKTVAMTCGNPAFMADIEEISSRLGFKFEKEEW